MNNRGQSGRPAKGSASSEDPGPGLHGQPNESSGPFSVRPLCHAARSGRSASCGCETAENGWAALGTGCADRRSALRRRRLRVARGPCAGGPARGAHLPIPPAATTSRSCSMLDIRPATPDDLELIARWLADPPIATWLDFGPGRDNPSALALKVANTRGTDALFTF